VNPQDNDPLHAPINARLAEIVEAATTPPLWYDDWMGLGPESSEEERLAVYQAIRDSGCLPAEAGFYLVSWQLDAMTSLEAEISLRHLDERMKAIEERHGLAEGKFWPPGKAPVEYEELRQEYQDAWDRIFAAMLERYGEQEMVRQLRADPEGFQRQSKAGQAFFHGPQEPEDTDAPDWVYGLVEAVAARMEALSGPGPLGFLYREEEGIWDIAIYPKPVELAGGAEDGRIVAPAFSLDLEELRAEFERVDAVSWKSLGYPGGEGPHVSIEGVYQGHLVFVRVLAYAPEDEEPGMRLDTSPPKH